MAKVTISGNVWDHAREPIAEDQQPQLWFIPTGARVGPGLLGDVGTRASLNVSSGAFTVQVESALGISYTPVLEYLISGTRSEPLSKQAPGRIEFPTIYPGDGGDISALGKYVGMNGVLFGFGPPPPHLSNVVYLDITGPELKIYGPRGGNA